MTFKKAVNEMKVLAGIEYWTLKYEMTPTGIEIRGYIKRKCGNGWALPAATYAGAIENVKIMLGMLPVGMDDPPEDGETEDD